MSKYHPKILIIGHGSIALRIISILLKYHCRIHIYQHRPGLKYIPKTISVSSFKIDIDAVIIASSTSSHLKYLEYFAGKKPIFIEKPLTDKYNQRVVKLVHKLSNSPYFVMCGFQSRFIPVVEQLRMLLKQNKLGQILTATIYVGQYLPFWRPNISYTDSYSANYANGGGVALDLIHEIDLAIHWLGDLSNIKIINHKLGNLKIDTENYVKINTAKSPFIQITMDSLNHNKSRIYNIIGEIGSVYIDLYHDIFLFTGNSGKTITITKKDQFDVNRAYISEFKYFLNHLSKPPSLNLDRFLGIDALKIATKARKHYV
jgi:predicted dehydrogenase